ncbi:type IV pilus modification PilV family protein [Pengzhenrongella sicca]|uniref:Type II secretion system protein n=1 Tax=Pengzhenrongella sicca TaxID=2819238 RepID=A0A8A4ZAV2_9MICO|nr:type II secretion system protein [Pengzhenrongella sicca]QTE28013.1 type II secretion system protein [Pengzhenrongella sicca]
MGVRRAHDGGFTLVEVMVSLLILAIVAAGLGTLTISVARAQANARKQAVAAELASQRSDLLRGSLAVVKANTGAGAATLAATGACVPAVGLFQTVKCTRGSGTYLVSAVRGSVDGFGVYPVTVTVTWTAQAAARSIVTQTRIWAP